MEQIQMSEVVANKEKVTREGCDEFLTSNSLVIYKC